MQNEPGIGISDGSCRPSGHKDCLHPISEKYQGAAVGTSAIILLMKAWKSSLYQSFRTFQYCCSGLVSMSYNSDAPIDACRRSWCIKFMNLCGNRSWYPAVCFNLNAAFHRLHIVMAIGYKHERWTILVAFQNTGWRLLVCCLWSLQDSRRSNESKRVYESKISTQWVCRHTLHCKKQRRSWKKGPSFLIDSFFLEWK